MKRTGVAALFFVTACARTGLFGFGEADGDETAGAGAQGGSAGGAAGSSAGFGGLDANECRTNDDCPPSPDRCLLPVCLGADAREARRRCGVQELRCDDGDSCSFDRCDPASGVCMHHLPDDADGDGFVAEPAPDSPVECGGRDCDDEDADVFPGAPEQCDGKDNDCNAGIDDGFDYSELLGRPVLISSPDAAREQRGGLVWNGSHYAVTYTSLAERNRSYFKLIDPGGADASELFSVSQINADTYAGLVAASESGFLTAWADARQSGNYEVYAARFAPDGQKLQADLRLSDAESFSLNPVVLSTGDGYVVAWDDRRDQDAGTPVRIYGRRLSVDGTPIGDEVALSPAGDAAEYPALALGERSIGLAYVVTGPDGNARAHFRAFDMSLAGGTPPVELPLSLHADEPSVAYVTGRFVIAWHVTNPDATPGAAIQAAAVDERGGPPMGGHPVTFGFTFVRTQTLVSLGDRVFLVFAGAGPDGLYDLWGHAVSAELNASAGTRLTTSASETLLPVASVAANGEIGVLYDEVDEIPPTSREAYFLSVGCSGF